MLYSGITLSLLFLKEHLLENGAYFFSKTLVAFINIIRVVRPTWHGHSFCVFAFASFTSAALREMSVGRRHVNRPEARGIISIHSFAVYRDDAWQVTVLNLQALRREEVSILPLLETNGLQW